jgi:hypothetical protein
MNQINHFLADKKLLMRIHAPFYILLCSLFYFSNLTSQDSNIQFYTPSKLMQSGQWDIKWFNNLYTEVLSVNEKKQTINSPRKNFFTSSLDVFTGLSASAKWNVGFHLEYRSNTINGLGVLNPFQFKETPEQRHGLSRIAPSIKVAPFKNMNNLSIQSAFSIPLFDLETDHGVYLDQKGFIWQNKVFYDYSSINGIFQIFTELNTEYNFGKKEDSFANDSLRVSPGIFFSYFPNENLTVLGLIQHASLIAINNEFSQDYSAYGGGAKYQLSPTLNVEVLYTNFFRGNSTGLGQTFNLGLRAVIN